MTTIVVVVDPPREGLVLPALVESSRVTPGEATELYAATVKDSMRAAADSGGEVLVNYRRDEDLPEAYRTGESVEAVVRSLAGQALDDPDETRFEVQVGSSYEARVGNTVTHLLRDEEVGSVAVLDGTAPTVTRTVLDSAAMKLRRTEAVIGPALAGRVSYLGLTESIDFAGSFDPPELGNLVGKVVDAGLVVDFLPIHPTVRSVDGLDTLYAVLEAQQRADRRVPAFTMDVLNRLDLRVEDDDTEDHRAR